MSHVTHLNKSGHMAHISLSHVTHMNESWHTYGWVILHIWLSDVTHMNESWHSYKWDMPKVTHVNWWCHTWMRHVAYMNVSCHTYGWATSHIWMRHVTHMNESCHMCEWATSHIRMRYAQGHTCQLMVSRTAHVLTHEDEENVGHDCFIWVACSHGTHMSEWCHT